MNESYDCEEDMELYAGGDLASNDVKVANWLKWTYVILPIWGIIWFCLYWNGSHGWLDRGYWFQLEEAAGTTFKDQSSSP